MEIFRWAVVAGKGRSTPWLLPATAGFCAVFVAVALCVKSAVARRSHGEFKGSNPTGDRGWNAVKKKVMSSVRKGGFLRRLRDDDGQVSFLREAEEGGRVSTATPPPLWQKKIIMGEKCELPTFSGLILYDENGNALPHARKTDYR